MTDYQKFPLQLSKTAKFLVHRLNENRDLKIIITGKGATTGISKTTAAIHFADLIHQIQICQACEAYTYPDVSVCHRCGCSNVERQLDEWDPRELAFFDPWEYMDYYTNDSSKGEALLLDEAEYSIHKRRHMSGENVEMSKVWAALRYRRCVSILTLPSTSMIDSMMMELGDMWFNATKKGVVNTYYYFYNDFTQEVYPIRIRNEMGWPEQFIFSDLGDTWRKKYLDDGKEEFTQENQAEHFDSEDLATAEREAKIEQRAGIVEKLLAHTEFSQDKIASLVHPEDGESMSQGWVSKINNGDLGFLDSGDEKYPIRE